MRYRSTVASANTYFFLSLMGGAVVIAMIAVVRFSTESGANYSNMVRDGQAAVQQVAQVATEVPALPTMAPLATAPAIVPSQAGWLDVLDEAGFRFVYVPGEPVGEWLNCAYIDRETLTYQGVAWIAETWAQKVWKELGIQQDAVLEVCGNA